MGLHVVWVTASLLSKLNAVLHNVYEQGQPKSLMYLVDARGSEKIDWDQPYSFSTPNYGSPELKWKENAYFHYAWPWYIISAYQVEISLIWYYQWIQLV